MPKATPKPPPAEQSKRFISAAKKLVDSGELSLTEAEAAMDSLVKKGARKRPES